MPAIDEPNMSDNTLLVSVEDLINMSMGPPEGNCVDFKMVQTILHILARQMRLLEQKVVVEVGELPPPTVLKPPKQKTPTPQSTSTDTEKTRATARKKKREDDIKEEPDGRRRSRQASREKVRERSRSVIRDRSESAVRDKSKGRADKTEQKDKERAEKEALKEKERLGKMSQKEREKAEREAQKEKERYDKMSQKEKDKADKEAQKEKEKYEKMSQKEKDKADREAQKEKEKYDKMSQKEKDKADKEAQKEKEKYEKMSEKEREKADKEKEKYEKMNQKEREKADKEAQKEKERYEKMTQKEREKADKEKEKYEKMSQKEKEKADKEAQKEREKAEQAPGRGKKGRGEEMDSAARKSSIGVSEVRTKTKEKVLVVEKGPTTRAQEAGRRASIEVVTRSQFALLEAAVAALKERAGPLPPLTLPDNQQLRTDLARGSVSLTDTMQAMQVSARVQAAEAAIGRLGGLLTQLAARSPHAAGLTEGDEDEEDAIAEMAQQEPHRPSTVSRKSVMIQAKTTKAEGGHGAGGGMSARQSVASAASRGSGARPSVTSRATLGGHVTHPEMSEALQSLRDELMRNVQNMTNRATSAADTASNFAKSVAEKLEVALGLDSRINSLQSLVNDYSEQLSGFDAGLTTQMQSFQEQMTQMRNDLRGGLAQLDNANNNAETAAVMELTERYDLLVADLDHTLLAHQALTAFQEQLSVDFRSLLECVEMLREQKADRDEVLDGLRDKADNERLAGLLREAEFEEARAELERRLDMCHDKFRRQDAVWVAAIKDLTTVVQTKAELMELLKTRDETTYQLQEMQDMIRKLALVLGEPKAAMLTRKLARGALCGACLVPALMEPEDAASGKPPALPAALRHPPVGAEQPCAPDWRPPESPDLRTHTCHRWVGGSHTLLDAGARKHPGPLPALPAATKKYVGQGRDGRLYMMEAELDPCVECNPLESGAPAQPGGGGDGATRELHRHTIGGEPADGKADCVCDPVVQDKMPE